MAKIFQKFWTPQQTPLPMGEDRISTRGTSVRNSGEGKAKDKQTYLSNNAIGMSVILCKISLTHSKKLAIKYSLCTYNK